jgi:hypothetical protein
VAVVAQALARQEGMNMMKHVGFGVFTWERSERVNNRYGSVYPASVSYSGEGECENWLDTAQIGRLQGRRVRLVCEVVTTRESGHIGDFFLQVFPSTPEVGDVVEVGVGILRLTKHRGGDSQITIEPIDGRADLWLDPHILYRLHDQTVNFYVEEPDEPGPKRV